MEEQCWPPLFVHLNIIVSSFQSKLVKSILSIEDPKQAREDGDFFKYLKLEQEIERAHNVLNTLERQFECVKNKVEKFYLMIRGYKNLQKCGKDITSVRKPINKKIKSNLKKSLKRLKWTKVKL